MTRPLTVTDLLGGATPGSPLELGLRRANVAAAALGPLTEPVMEPLREAVTARLTEVLGQLTAIDLGDVLLGGWSTCRELLAAAARTREDPSRPEDVVLAEHDIDSTHHPSVEVIIDGAQIATLTFDLILTLTVTGLIAVVEHGRLVALGGGRLTARIELSWQGKDLITPQSYPLTAGAVVRLGRGVLLGGSTRPRSA